MIENKRSPVKLVPKKSRQSKRKRKHRPESEVPTVMAGYYGVPRELLRWLGTGKISEGAFLTWETIHAHELVPPHGQPSPCIASYDRLARLRGLDRQTIMDHVDELDELKLVIRKRRRHRCGDSDTNELRTNYALPLFQCLFEKGVVSQETPPSVSYDTRGGVSGNTTVVSQETPKRKVLKERTLERTDKKVCVRPLGEGAHTPDIASLIEHFKEEYERIHQSPYSITDKDNTKKRALQILLELHGVDELKRRITAYLEHPHEWMKRGARWSIELFVGEVNDYGARTRKRSWRDGIHRGSAEDFFNEEEDDSLDSW